MAAHFLEVDAIGVSVPGIVHHEDGTMWAPNLAGWERYPLLEALRAEVGNSCPIVLESDRASSIVGDVPCGVARGYRHAIFLAAATDIGAGILADGSILRGTRDIAGAVGWTGLDRRYPAPESLGQRQGAGSEGYGDWIMEGYDFDPRDTRWIVSHSGINAATIDVALRAKPFLRAHDGRRSLPLPGGANRDWLLGRNPWGCTMFTEIGAVFPKDVHLQTTKLTGRRVRGALVDGPVYERIFRTQRGVSITQPDPLAPFHDPRAV